MGYASASLIVSARLSDHNDERDERHALAWLDLRHDIALLCAQEKYADIEAMVV